MKYEYRILQTTTPTASEAQLTGDYGAQGWALVQIYHYNGIWYYVFTRQILN